MRTAFRKTVLAALCTLPFVVNPQLFRKLPFAVSDFAPVSLMIAVPFVLVVHNSLPAKSVQDLIGLAKAQSCRAQRPLRR